MLISYIRTFVLYIVLILTVRLMGKRQIGEMEPAEFVVTMLIANLAAIPMQDSNIPLYSGLLPILIVLGLELIIAVLSMRCIPFRRLFCGKPVILIDRGKIVQQNLRRTRVTLDELTEHLREKDIFDLSTIKYAILETNGEISTLLYAANKPAPAKSVGIPVTDGELPFTIISDGKLLPENLALAGLDRSWLNAQLARQKTTIPKTLLLTVDRNRSVYFAAKEEAT